MEAANDNPIDVLKGAEEIAAFLGEDVRAVYYAVKKGSLPVYRLGESIRARKSVLIEWMRKQEATAFQAA